MSAAIDPAKLAAALKAGDRKALARAITLAESTRQDHREAAEAVLADRGEPRSFLQPDLPLEGLCKFWAGRSNGTRS